MADPQYPVQSHNLLIKRHVATSAGQDALTLQYHAQWLASLCLVDHRNRIIYCPIAKNASSSLKRMYLVRSGRDRELRNSPSNMHQFIDSNLDRFALQDLGLLEDASYFSFIVLRNPFQRLVSAYADKFVYKSRGEHTDHHAAPVIAAVQRGRGNAVDLPAGISFREFVQHLHAAEDHQLDPHWLPQSLYYGEALVQWRMVVQFDKLGTLFDHLQTIYPGGRPGPNLGYKVPYAQDCPITGFVDTTSKAEFLAMEEVPPPASFYPPDLEALVRERYAEDIAIFEKEFGIAPQP